MSRTLRRDESLTAEREGTLRNFSAGAMRPKSAAQRANRSSL